MSLKKRQQRYNKLENEKKKKKRSGDKKYEVDSPFKLRRIKLPSNIFVVILFLNSPIYTFFTSKYTADKSNFILVNSTDLASWPS